MVYAFAYLIAYMRKILAKPRVFVHHVLREPRVVAPKNPSGKCATYSAKSGAEPFAQTQRPFLLAVPFLDDETVPVDSDPRWRQREIFNLLLEDHWIDQRARWDEQTRSGIDESSWRWALPSGSSANHSEST